MSIHTSIVFDLASCVWLPVAPPPDSPCLFWEQWGHAWKLNSKWVPIRALYRKTKISALPQNKSIEIQNLSPILLCSGSTVDNPLKTRCLLDSEILHFVHCIYGERTILLVSLWCLLCWLKTSAFPVFSGSTHDYSPFKFERVSSPGEPHSKDLTRPNSFAKKKVGDHDVVVKPSANNKSSAARVSSPGLLFYLKPSYPKWLLRLSFGN